MATGAHVPAWKRIGLQLKEPSQTVNQPTIQPPSKKRRIESTLPTPQNNIRSSTGNRAHITNLTNHARGDNAGAATSASRKNGANNSHEHTEESRLPNTRIRFSPEAPATSANTLASKSTNGTSKAILTAESGAGVDAHDHSSVDALQKKIKADGLVDVNKIKKREKRQNRKKKKSSKNEPTQPETKASETSDSKPYLDYLEQFHLDHRNWKFNKSLQNRILKHVFDMDAIPKNLEAALLAYIGGLQGEASKERLGQEATEILELTRESQVEKEKKTDERKSAMKQDQEKIKQAARNNDPDRRLRASEILQIVKAGDRKRSAGVAAADPSQRKPKRKRRKARTTAIADDVSDVSSVSSDPEPDNAAASDSDSDGGVAVHRKSNGQINVRHQASESTDDDDSDDEDSSSSHSSES